MKGLQAIISIFSEEEKVEFLKYLEKKNRRGDVKNSLLFKLIESGKTKDLDIILYGKPSKNAYHALSKRLQDSLIDFVASRSFAGETNEEMEILKLLLSARILFEHKQYPTAFRILNKAEQLAISLDVYALLTEIYHTKIQYAHLNQKIKLSELFERSQTNLKHFQQEQQLNMAYATIKKTLKGTTKQSVNEIVTKTFSEFEIVISNALTYKSLFQLMNITVTAAKLQSDYYTVSEFIVRTYEVVSEKQSQINTEKHLFYHIEILNLMAATHFRNKNFKESMAFTEKMKVEMEKKKGKYYPRFLEKQLLIRALNLNYTSKADEAIKVLKSFAGISLDIELTLAMTLFQQDRFQEAYEVLKNMYHSDIWYEKKAGWLWVLKKSIVEILLLIELDRFDLVLSRLQSFKAKFTKKLKTSGEERAIHFIKLVSLYYEDPSAVTSIQFKEKVEVAFEWIGKEREDIFVMSFYAWLKAKMEQKDLYQTTLELVH